jgi:Phosphodiester glycosidase
MKRTRLFLNLLVLVFIITASLPQPALGASNAWTPVADGIDWQKFHSNKTNNSDVFVARMDRNNPNVTIDSSIAQGKLYSGFESVRNQANRYDGAINFWGKTWGNTNQVAVAINGYFFDNTGLTGTPWSGQIQSGWYAQRFWENQAVSGFAWQLDREAFIGECVYHQGKNNEVASDKVTINIASVNQDRVEDALTIYTPQYDSSTHTDDQGVEVVVQLEKPALVSSNPVNGVVQKVYDGVGNTKIPFDSVVLSGYGKNLEPQLRALKVGDALTIQQQITDCQNTAKGTKPDWTNTYAAIGGDKFFLFQGDLIDIPGTEFTAPAPRTAIAFNDQYIYFIVVDGYHTNVSPGMSINQIGSFAKDTLQATYGVSQDSGSSSTMVINGKVVNNIHCNYLHANGCDDSSNPVYKPPDYEPTVGNGLMMVVVRPRLQVTNFKPDDLIGFVGAQSLYLGPGTNYGVAGQTPDGSQAVILDHPLDGIWAKGSFTAANNCRFFWWYVKASNGVKGWTLLPESSPQATPTPTPTMTPTPPPLDFSFFDYLPFLNSYPLPTCS